ncbi:Mth938-like domain-containing protein [Arenimonas composti]|uniref:Mth938-like domain-containing protein n=1 Tax=Arenimonas composti TR7-09 = DSM 18010 TaxID=1121013 RepID=A0A091BFH4_9GAMM|nr:Mth938-like domain-containing protein [Arenimonas composti]KFN50307.1 hypothetical protein P873_06425 [Arenimonas composti TR7-09 = DSM 18010]
MQLVQDNPDFRYVLRGADGAAVRVNERTLTRSFLLAPDRLVEDWRPRTVVELDPADFEPVLALAPELVLLGTGATHRFPGAAAMAALLTRGIGLEAMDNAAAARTFNVLAGEGRRVVVAFLLDADAGS